MTTNDNTVENSNNVQTENKSEQVEIKSESKAKKLATRYFITAFSGMAMGLFCTLIAGTIVGQIAKLIGVDNGFGALLALVGNIASVLMGAGIGVGIAYKLEAKGLVLFGAAVAGMVGAFLPQAIFDVAASGEAFSLMAVAQKVQIAASLSGGRPGNPIGSYITVIFSIEIANLVSGKTKLDILLVPLTVMAVAFVSSFVAVPAVWLISLISKFIEVATEAQPFIMGVVISAVMGVLLTMPTSSAAIWAAIATGVTSNAMLLAGGAAACGCAAHMIGFAVQSYRENKIGGLIAQGLGTSMLQIPNIMKKPIIMLPPIVASIIVGPLSTCVFKLKCNASGGGMGTSGLVGVFGVIAESPSTWTTWLGIALCMFIIPAAVCLALSEFMRKKGLIKPEYLKLDI